MKSLRDWFRKRNKRLRAIRFYKSIIPKDSLCFDVGAHQGEVSQFLLSVGMHIVAIEPLSECYPKLEIIKRKYPEKFNIVRLGVAATDEPRPFYKGRFEETSTFSKDFIASYGHYAHNNWIDKGLIECTTLNNLIKEYGLPYLIKMDIEGYEADAISTLNMPISIIQFEWNQLTFEVAIEVIRKIETLGEYLYNWWPHEKYHFFEKRDMRSDELIKKLEESKDVWLTGEIVARLKSQI